MTQENSPSPPALEKRFDAAAIEKKWRVAWKESGVFTADPKKVKALGGTKDPFVIIMPPPNVTGSLHLGHAMRDAIEDCLIRWRRMRGDEALFLPGLDHAGIATQMMVSKDLEKQGIKRQDLGREKFLEKVWAWKALHGNTILEQKERMGISCDWSRLAFTLDEKPSRAVRYAFKKLWDEKLLYRGEYLINWCPSCRTALSDLETDHVEKDGSLWHITYPFADGASSRAEGSPGGLTVATTRPETMLGDTAVAVHPDDERYKALVGKKLKLPLTDREIPIVADSFVDPKFGTGCVKITPAHDPNDFEAGKRLNLPSINIMNEDATMNEAAGPDYAGLDRFMARKKVVKALEALGLLAKIDKHKNQIGVCDRCKTVVEPRLSTQWFIKMKPMAEKALMAHAAGEFKFTPDHWGKVFTNWLNEIHDWCISRQLWWGHRIPAWYCEKHHITVTDSETAPTQCAECGAKELKQDDDVLDTWFSSQLWPLSTLGWPDTEHPDFKAFYPGQVMETGYDILFFWVARMLMAGLHFDGRAPFQNIYLSGLIRDKHGKKMSKTAGNTVDPLEMIDKYGADALRFTLIIGSVGGTDVALDPARIEGYRDFATKLWNAARFVLMQIGDRKISTFENLPRQGDVKSPVNRWLIAEYVRMANGIDPRFMNFQFHGAANDIYHFVWNIYCDWAIELSKHSLLTKDEYYEETLQTLVSILQESIVLLNPMMPFITSEIYEHLPVLNKKSRIEEELYPTEYSYDIGAPTETLNFSQLQGLLSAIRNLRTTAGIPAGENIDVDLFHQQASTIEFLRSTESQWRGLAKIGNVKFLKEQIRPNSGIPGIGGNIHFNLIMTGAKLAEDERAKLEADRTKLLAEKEKLGKQLAVFSDKTPAAVKEKTAAAIADAVRKIEVIAFRLRE